MGGYRKSSYDDGKKGGTVTIRGIVAMDEGRVIGDNGALPWHLPEDLRRFARLTKGGTVVMGRRTFDSLPEHARPLKDRENIVVTRGSGTTLPSSVRVYSDLSALIAEMRSFRDRVFWIIGGEELYRQTLPYWDEAFVTVVDGLHAGDRWMPPFEADFTLVDSEEGPSCRFLRYVRSSPPEVLNSQSS